MEAKANEYWERKACEAAVNEPQSIEKPTYKDAEIGKKINELRLIKGETQTELGEALGVSREIIQHWERGSRQIKANAIINIARHFEVSADYLLGTAISESNDSAVKLSETELLTCIVQILYAFDSLEFVIRAINSPTDCTAQTGLVELAMHLLGFDEFYDSDECDERRASMNRAWVAIINSDIDVEVRAKTAVNLSMLLNNHNFQI